VESNALLTALSIASALFKSRPVSRLLRLIALSSSTDFFLSGLSSLIGIYFSGFFKISFTISVSFIGFINNII
jgi:hypothetical protein